MYKFLNLHFVSRKRGVITRSYVLFQISSRERGVIKRSRHSSGRSMSEEEPQTLLEECWLDGQEILEREQHIKKIEVCFMGLSPVV